MSSRLRVAFLPWLEFDPSRHDLIVQATPLGRSAAEGLAVDVARLPSDAAVVDLVYKDGPTALVAAARARGLTAIDGREVLLWQAALQFRMMTGRPLPLDVAVAALGLGPGALR